LIFTGKVKFIEGRFNIHKIEVDAFGGLGLLHEVPNRFGTHIGERFI